MKINRLLIEKYNKPVPRYTSYPPANFFTENYSADDYLEDLEQSNYQETKNISFYIHIPFCHKMCHYCGCNSTPMAKEDRIKTYIEALEKEIAIVCERIDKTRKISQIHYGGGTPNSIPVTFLQKINGLLFEKFETIEKPEIAIECHPAFLDKEYIEGLKLAGFNRISLGIQDFNLEVLNAVNRDPSKLPLPELVDLLRGINNATVNFDFIYGLPYQTTESFGDTIKQAIELEPDRLVTFSYAHVPWVNKAQLILERQGLPTAMEKIEMTEYAYNYLTTNGYHSIGMDHYVKATDDLFTAQQNGMLHRNFQGYCTRETTGQVYAFGVSGISQFTGAYAQNTKKLKDYISTLNSGSLPIVKGIKRSGNESIIGNFITHFMCNKGVDWEKFSSDFNITTEDLKNALNPNEPELIDFQNEGLIITNANGIQITENGLPFIRNIVASFDPALKQTNKSFSKAV